VNEAGARITRTIAIRDAELDFVNTIADAYFNPSGSNGLEQQLAQLDYDYAALEAAAKSAALSTLATTSNTPWADYAEDEFDAEENNLASATRSLQQQRRLAKAEAARKQAISLTEAERELAISSIQAEANLDIQTAQANSLAVTYNTTSSSSIDLLLDVAPSTPDLGQINVVSTSYAVAQPGSIGDGWYTSYLGSYSYGNWYYSWNGYGSYYGASTGQYDFGWGYDGFAGASGGFGAYFGSWGYGPGAFGWGGWSPSYVSTPVAATGGHAIDVESAVAGYTAKVDSLTAPVETTTNGLAASEQKGIPQINLVEGDVNPDSTGATTSNPVAQNLAASVKVIADESTGFTWEGTFEEYLKEYGDEGLGLYAFVTRQGWEVQKGSYGWVNTRQDWWLDTEEKILYIGDTDWGGIAYRSNENAAAQLYEGLEGVLAHEDFLKEIDLIIGEDWSETGWYEASKRMGAAILFNSIFTGIKRVENALEGETVTGNKIEGWDRLKLGAFGSIETLLVVVPAGKAVVAAGGKVGLGSLASASIRSAMAADISFGFGPAATSYLASSRVGQGFIRAYAKVYNSKYNKALIGTTKQEIKVGGTGAAATTPDEAAIAQARQRATNTKRVGSTSSQAAPKRIASIYNDLSNTPLNQNLGHISDDTLVHFSPHAHPIVKPGAGGKVSTFRYGDIKHLTPKQIETIIGPLAAGGEQGGARVLHVLDVALEDAIKVPAQGGFFEYTLNRIANITERWIVQ